MLYSQTLSIPLILLPSIIALSLPARQSLRNLVLPSSIPNVTSHGPILPISNVPVPAPAFGANLSSEFLDSINDDSNGQLSCQGMFGTELNYESCLDALRGMSTSTVPLNLGDRGRVRSLGLR